MLSILNYITPVKSHKPIDGIGRQAVGSRPKAEAGKRVRYNLPCAIDNLPPLEGVVKPVLSSDTRAINQAFNLAHAIPEGRGDGEKTEQEGARSVEGSKYHLPQEWATYLSRFKWDWFVTIAPADMPHPESLDKLFDLFVHRVNIEVYGKHYWKDKRKGVFWAKATEYQKRGCPHHHALVGGVPDYVVPVIHRNFLYTKNTSSKIEPYEKEKGAEYYLSKSAYAWKRGEIDCSRSLVFENEGKRICGKKIHQEYCGRYTALTKPDLNQFVW